MQKNIFLTGIMGSGKTSIGKKISEISNFQFFDTDIEIEKSENKKISEIFEKHGEKYFRDLEKDQIVKLANKTQAVISLGGGAFCNSENIEIIKKAGKSVYLKTSSDQILKRLNQEEIAKRPLLKNKENFYQLLEKREHFYQQADLIILTDGKNIEEIALEVLEKTTYL